ncbi:hypothetical protein BDN72DRAFT_895983 [Pluteus cervinus]|uniref:Uncharacterized protein n=1 Tax=Pluteus cervinus TaxID=181527 RepID=A0ACD3AZ43_9AGAR|nr:hypothetical protein BDN72DRAFT_895983 [Pluteus cervinus]
MVLRMADLGRGIASGSRAGIHCSEGAGDSPWLQLNISPRTEDMLRSWTSRVKDLPLDDIEALSTDVFWSAADWKDSPWHSLPTIRQLILRDDRTSSAYLEYLVALETEGADPEGPFLGHSQLWKTCRVMDFIMVAT